MHTMMPAYLKWVEISKSFTGTDAQEVLRDTSFFGAFMS